MATHKVLLNVSVNTLCVAIFFVLSNVQKITSAENLRPRAFDDLAIELSINCNRKIAEVIF